MNNLDRIETVRGTLIFNKQMTKNIGFNKAWVSNEYIDNKDSKNVISADIVDSNILTKLHIPDTHFTLIEKSDREISLFDNGSHHHKLLALKDDKRDLESNSQANTLDELSVDFLKNKEKLRDFDKVEWISLDAEIDELFPSNSNQEAMNKNKVGLNKNLRDYLLFTDDILEKDDLDKGNVTRNKLEILEEVDKLKVNYRQGVYFKNTHFADKKAIDSNRTVNADIEGELSVDLFLPERLIDYVSIGDHVALKFDAFPFENFGAIDSQVVNIEQILTATKKVTHFF